MHYNIAYIGDTLPPRYAYSGWLWWTSRYFIEENANGFRQALSIDASIAINIFAEKS